MMATVLHVTSGSGLRKFQADGFLFDRVYQKHIFFMISLSSSARTNGCRSKDSNKIHLRKRNKL